MPKRVLYVAYEFPPVGGAGVQRTTKFVKYLPEFGWDVSVLTVANPSVPLLDHSLADEIPADTVVCRAPTLEPSYKVKATVTAGSARRRGVRSLVRGAARAAARTVLQPDPQ